ncbi:MAG: FkbM family methyltransferase [Candidatus Eisenbacteria bacterium]
MTGSRPTFSTTGRGGMPWAPSWLKAVGRVFLRSTGLYAGYSLLTQGPLREDGWLRSFRAGHPVDAAGEPVPWLTYPAIEFLAARVRSEWRVFEYGAGASTRWWAARVSEVVSVEHDRGWYERVKGGLPATVTLRHVPLEYGGDYARSAAANPGRFDVVVIDGRDRVNCARAALVGLNPTGVIVWDNSDRAEYAEGHSLLLAAGFRKVPFVGMAPVFNQKSETAVYYRDGNVVGL